MRRVRTSTSAFLRTETSTLVVLFFLFISTLVPHLMSTDTKIFTY